MAMLRHLSHLLRRLLPLPNVQFWETENSWRLASSHRGGHRRDIPRLVDASDIRTVSAIKALWCGHGISATAILRKYPHRSVVSATTTFWLFSFREELVGRDPIFQQ